MSKIILFLNSDTKKFEKNKLKNWKIIYNKKDVLQYYLFYFYVNLDKIC